MARSEKLTLLYLLYQAGKHIESMAKTHKGDEANQAMILAYVAKKPATISDIAEFAGIRVSAATTKVLALERLGLLARAAGGDKRSHQVVLTNKGKQRIDMIERHMEQKMEGVQLGITKASVRQMIAALRRIRWEELYEKHV